MERVGISAVERVGRGRRVQGLGRRVEGRIEEDEAGLEVEEEEVSQEEAEILEMALREVFACMCLSLWVPHNKISTNNCSGLGQRACVQRLIFSPDALTC